MKQIVCDRCGATRDPDVFAMGQGDWATLARLVYGREHVHVYDLCAACTDAVGNFIALGTGL